MPVPGPWELDVVIAFKDEARALELAASHPSRLAYSKRWLAYVSEEAGRPVVSVRAMSGPPKRLVVSSDGGSQPVWRRDGQELLYVDLEGRFRGRPVLRPPTRELTLGVAMR